MIVHNLPDVAEDCSNGTHDMLLIPISCGPNGSVEVKRCCNCVLLIRMCNDLPLMLQCPSQQGLNGIGNLSGDF